MIQCQQDCLVKVDKRNLDDTEAEILYHKVASDQREPPRIVSRETSTKESAGRDPVRRELVALRLEPKVDHRCDGIPKEVLNNDQARQELISPTKTDFTLDKASLAITKVDAEKEEYLRLSVTEGHVEAFELKDLTDKIQ